MQTAERTCPKRLAQGQKWQWNIHSSSDRDRGRGTEVAVGQTHRDRGEAALLLGYMSAHLGFTSAISRLYLAEIAARRRCVSASSSAAPPPDEEAATARFFSVLRGVVRRLLPGTFWPVSGSAAALHFTSLHFTMHRPYRTCPDSSLPPQLYSARYA